MHEQVGNVLVINRDFPFAASEAAIIPNIFARFQTRPDNLTKTPAFERQNRPISARQSATAGVCPIDGAAPTRPRPGSSCSSPYRDNHLRCSNGVGTPNR
jgi:hypothetical protein